MNRFLKFLIGVILFPLGWAASRTLYLLLIASSSGSVHWALPAGFLVSVVGFFVLPQALRTYVLGHELTHALWGLLLGAKIGRMKVGTSGGYVELSKTNFIISLAPYFFPFYTALVIGLWFGLGCLVETTPYEVWWLGAVGLTWGFHVTFTILMLSQHQPDVHEHGRLFSYAVIYLANLFFVSIWVIALGEMTFGGGWNILNLEAVRAYHGVWEAALVAVQWLQRIKG